MRSILAKCSKDGGFHAQRIPEETYELSEGAAPFLVAGSIVILLGIFYIFQTDIRRRLYCTATTRTAGGICCFRRCNCRECVIRHRRLAAEQPGDIGYVLYSDHSRRICLFHMVRHLCVALLFAIYQRRDTGNRDTVKSIGPWFILSVFNMAWLILWHYLYIEWSVVVMFLLLTLWVLCPHA